MPERQPQLERTTQTDLLYGLALDARSDVATLPVSATSDFTPSANTGEEISLSEYNGPRDRIAELAATRADSGLHHPSDQADERGKKPARGARWRYADGIAPRPASSTNEPAVHIEREAAAQPTPLWQRWRFWSQASCGWATSFTLHLFLLPMFALIGVATVKQTWHASVVGSQLTPTDILAVAAPQGYSTEPSAVEISGAPALVDAPQLAIDWQPALPQHQATIPVLLTSLTHAGPVDDIEQLFLHPGDADRRAGGETGTSGAPGGGNGAGEAKFFGAQASGQKFVFVVDCSNSMSERNRWAHACQELDESIERLSADQLFYVILFDGLVHRMFNHDEREAALYPATAENKQLVRAWLQTARLGPETRPFLAMRCAMELRPDAIFLLSDGDFNDPTASYLKEANRTPEVKRKSQPLTTIHTINFHNRSLSGTAMLKRIARENGGKYTFVSPD